MEEMVIKSPLRDFRVVFAEDFSFIDEFIKTDNYVVIVDRNIYLLYKKELFKKFSTKKTIVILFTEQAKTLDTVKAIYEKLLAFTAKKNLTIISFGGGISQDVVGFAASTLYRGVQWIYVPTTLLAMADSAIGLKTSLNFKKYKNVLGTFYSPTKVIINSHFLKTLPKKEYYSGMGEIVKFYLMKERAVEELEESVKKINMLRKGNDLDFVVKIIKESMGIKLSYMRGDEFDTGRRNLLNYGHEFGHALESSSQFSIPHGIAIMIGMIFANYVALDRGYLKKDLCNNINSRMLFPNIPFELIKLRKEAFDKKTLFENMKKDKKRVTKDLVLVLPKKNFVLQKIDDLGYGEFDKNLNILKNELPLV